VRWKASSDSAFSRRRFEKGLHDSQQVSRAMLQFADYDLQMPLALAQRPLGASLRRDVLPDLQEAFLSMHPDDWHDLTVDEDASAVLVQVPSDVRRHTLGRRRLHTRYDGSSPVPVGER